MLLKRTTNVNDDLGGLRNAQMHNNERTASKHLLIYILFHRTSLHLTSRHVR